MPTKCLCDKTPIKRKKRTKVKSSGKSFVPQQKNPNAISVILQGSAMNLPAPLTNDYNKILQQLDLIRREQAQAGSLISNVGRNDLLNRVQATNPFSVASTNTQTAMLDPYEGEMEEVVESSTTSNSYDNNSSDAQIPIDQDFIRQARINRFGQTLGGNTYKIGVGDAETISDLSAYDDEDLEDRLASSVAGTKGSSRQQEVLSDLELELIEQVKLKSEGLSFMTDAEREKYIKKTFNQTPITYQKKVKEMKAVALNKEWEDFSKAKEDEEKYLTRRINLGEPTISKKQKALSATSKLTGDIGKLTPTQNPKGRPANSEEDKKEKRREYQREYYRKKKGEEFKL